MPASTEATRSESLEPIISAIFQNLRAAISDGARRAIAISPPGTGKSTAALRVAFRHFHEDNPAAPALFHPRRVLYIGANQLAVEQQCQRLAHVSNTPDGWEFISHDSKAHVVGATWKQIALSNFDPTPYTLVIADDAHQGMSPSSQHFLEGVLAPIVGFSNSMRGKNDTVKRERKGTDIVLTLGDSPLQHFFGTPVARFTYADIDKRGVSIKLPVISIGKEEPIDDVNDPRLVAIVDAYIDIFHKQGHCKTIIQTNGVEDAHELRKLLTSAFPPRNGIPQANIGLFYQELGRVAKKQTLHNFETGHTPILIHCGQLKEGVVLPDASLVVIAANIRSPHVFERIIGRAFHSDSPYATALDIQGNVSNLFGQTGHSGAGHLTEVMTTKLWPRISLVDTNPTIIFGTPLQYESFVNTNTDEKFVPGTWTRESTLAALESLHEHGIGTKKSIPTRTQINLGAERGLCPPSWFVFTQHGVPGFFADGEDLAKAMKKLANQYVPSSLTRQEVIGAIRDVWEKDPPADGVLSGAWLQSKCNGIDLLFRFRSIVGTGTSFLNLTDLIDAFNTQPGLETFNAKPQRFNNPTKDKALDLIRELYKSHGDKPAIVDKNRPLKDKDIRLGSAARLCPSVYNLFETQNGSTAVFPEGIDEVNRRLGFLIPADFTKEKVLAKLHELGIQHWKFKNVPISQKEINAACKEAALDFSCALIIGEGKLWETKEEFDKDLGYQESPKHYRSLRQKNLASESVATPLQTQPLPSLS